MDCCQRTHFPFAVSATDSFEAFVRRGSMLAVPFLGASARSMAGRSITRGNVARWLSCSTVLYANLRSPTPMVSSPAPISFLVIMRYELSNRSAQRALAEEYQAV